MTDQHGLSYCADMVRRLDKDRFLTALFAPEPARSRLMALYAFNLEVARTRENVSEPMIGEIRLQWWRDALDAIYKGAPPEHEVAQALAQAIEASGLERGPLDRLIDARTFDLYDEPMQTRADLRAYLNGTSSALLEAAIDLIGSGGVEQETIEAAGQAWGLTGLLRALPIHIQRRQQFIPTEVLGRHNVAWSDFEDGNRTKTAPVISDLADRARAEISKLKSVTKNVRPVFLPASIARLYLRELAQPNCDPCTTIIDVPVFRKQASMIWRSLSGRL